jgi:hypothetical protein
VSLAHATQVNPTVGATEVERAVEVVREERDTAALQPLDPETGSNGVHAITKTTDYWFERELHVIERDAQVAASEWAARGLPRHDVPRTEPLEPEQVLAARCYQLFRDWQRRVRTKMQDAIEEGSQEVGRQVATLRNAITQLQANRSERAEVLAKVARIEAEAEREAARPVRYDAYIGGWVFWPFAVVLALVEFFANFPIFRLMLPMSRALSTVAQRTADNVDDTSLFAGPKLLLHEMLMHFEATIVALVAVVILVLFGKTFGGSLRPLLAFSADDFPLAAQTIRAHRRQYRALAAASVLGVVLVLTFLYRSRAEIATMTAARVASDSVRIATLARENASTTDRARIAQGTVRLLNAQQLRNQHEDDAAYAKVVQQNNVPILALNLGLICTAIVLGFSYKSEDLSDKRGEHPDIKHARDRVAELDRDSFAAVQQGRQAQGLAHAGSSRVQHLLLADPLGAWRSKAERVEGVIPLFRGENARLRGLDPANIRAFDEKSDLALDSMIDPIPLIEPAEFARLRDELDSLAKEFGQLVPRMTPAQSLLAVA